MGTHIRWRERVSSEKNNVSDTYIVEISEEEKEMGVGNSYLDGHEIQYEVEIPIMIQVVTSKNGASMYDVEYFNKPQVYEKEQYDHVYAITIMFCEKTVGAH